MDEFIIINKTKILERIQELKKPIAHYDGIYVSDSQRSQIELIEELLIQSTPLIPEIENAFDAGESAIRTLYDFPIHFTVRGEKQDYIRNLKLNI